MGRCAPDPRLTISLVSTKWSKTVWPLLAHASRALAMTVKKLRKLVYSSTWAKSRADQNSWPSALTRLIRSKVLLPAGAGSWLLLGFLLPEAAVQTKNELFTLCDRRGLVAHECILDLRAFKGTTAEDVAKRRMGYGRFRHLPSPLPAQGGEGEAPVARVDNFFGARNPVCSCVGMENYS